jgi:hypothetical protein
MILYTYQEKRRTTMEPTIFEVIIAILIGLPCLILIIGGLLPLNPNYDPNGNDPYRYCPKEEE